MTNNGKIVLNYLLENKNAQAPILSFVAFAWKHFDVELPKDVEVAYRSLSDKEDAEILIAFAESVE